MRKSSETGTGELEANAGDLRMTVMTPRDLVTDFREIAKRRDQTLSQEVRRLMREYVEREAA